MNDQANEAYIFATMAEFMKPAPPPPTPLGLHRPLSTTAGIRVSPLVLGGMSVGDAWAAFMGPFTKAQAFDLLDAFVAAGGNFIDTANCYQDEQSEQWIGEWMAARGNRDQVVISTKYSFHYRFASKDDKSPGNNNFWGNHRRSLHMSVRDSLAKLQTSWIDVLYVHFWDYSTSIKEVMDSLHRLVESGKVLYLGASDTPSWVVSAANTYAIAHGKTPFSIYQGPWNPLSRDLEREIVPMATHFGMAICPWNALAGGKLRIQDQPGASARSGSEQTQAEKQVSQALMEIGKSHGGKSVTAVALAYLISKAPNVFPLVGGRKIEHLKDNIEALDFELTDEEIELLEKAHDFDPGFPATMIGIDPALTGKLPITHYSQGPVAPIKKA